MNAPRHLRRRTALRLTALLGVPALLHALPVRAATYTWLGTSGNAWNIGANWQGGMAPPSDLANTDLVFTNSGGQFPSIQPAYSIRSLTFASNANAFTFDTGPLTLGVGGFTQNALNAQAFGAPIILGAAQTWTLGSGAGALTFGSGVNANGFALTVNAASTGGGGGNVVDGSLSGGSSLTKTGAGTVTFTGSHGYTGSVNANGGTLAFTGPGFGTVNNISVGGGGTLTLGGDAVAQSGNFVTVGVASATTAALNISGNAQLTSGDVLYVGNATVTQTGGTVTGNNSIFLGFNTLDNARYNLSGGTVNTNQLLIGDRASAIFSQSGGSVDAANGVIINFGPSSFGSFAYNLSGGSLTISDGTSTLDNDGTFNLSGTGAASAYLVHVGQYGNGIFNQTGGSLTATEMVFSGNTGTYNLDGGTLAASVLYADGGTSRLNLNGGTLKVNASPDANYIQGLSRANVRDGGARIDTNGSSVRIGQALLHSNITGDAATDGGLVKNGAGTLTLSAANTFTGPTTVTGGILNLANANALQNSTLAPSSDVPGTVSFDRTVTANAFTVGGLSGNGSLILANNATTPAPVALTIGNNNATTLYYGSLSGAGSLTKVGTGSTTLYNASTYTGGTQINGGTLLVNNNYGTSATGTGPVMVGNGGTLAGYGQVGGAVTVGAGGRVDPGFQSITPASLVLASTVTFQGNSLLHIDLGRPIIFTSTDTLFVSGPLTLSGNLEVSIISGYTLSVGQNFLIINNTGSDLTLGAFTNAPAGIYNDGAGNFYRVNYGVNANNGTTANDVTLTYLGLNVPEPGTWTAVLLGLGGLAWAKRVSRRRG